MSERKVLQKYYPPDYDVSKIPRLRLAPQRQLPSRIMLPMSLQCLRCGEFVYKGKKFNARKEHVQGEDYLGIKRWRFYFRCPSCLNEITFKTDPQRSGYEVELGASRNYEPWKARADDEAAQRAEREQQDADAMRRLENKSKEGQRDSEMAEIIEELRERNARGEQLSLEQLIDVHVEAKRRQEAEEDERIAKDAFSKRTLRPAASRPTPRAEGKEKRKALTVDALDFEVDDEDDEQLKGKEARLGAEDERAEAEAEADGDEDEFAKEKGALSASGLSFAATVQRTPVVVEEERKEGGLLSGISVLVKKRKPLSQPERDTKHRTVDRAPPPVTAVAPSPPVALSSLLGGYGDSDSD